MAQDELSKCIDDVHRRLDDLRADGLELRQEIAQFRHEVRQQLSLLQREMRLADSAPRQQLSDSYQGHRGIPDRGFRLLFWGMNIWCAFLAFLMTVYEFLW